MHETPSSLSYRPDIDGLRAIAVIPVVLYHLGIDPFTGGFVGVDVFFVISGFLITSIILPEVSNGSFSFARFYERRIRRLFPALFLVLTGTAIGSMWLFTPEELESFGESLMATTLFVSNFHFLTNSGYFEAPAELKPLLHTWSLAVEEQYYLLFPPLLLVLANRRAGLLVAGIVGLLTLSLLLGIWSVSRFPEAAFFLLHTRFWELLLGSVLAIGLVSAPASSRARGLLALLGIVLIGWSVVRFGATTPFPGLAAVVPCAGTALVIFAGQGGSHGITRLLAWRPLVFTGLLSYSIYLWHWPLIVFAKHYLMRPLEAPEQGIIVVLTLILSWVSWRFVEQPFRGRSGLLDRGRLFATAAGAAVVLVGVGLVMDQTEGLPARFDEAAQQLLATASDRPPDRHRCADLDEHQIDTVTLCRLGDLADTEPHVALWGDSHGFALSPAVDAAAREAGAAVWNLTRNRCAPLLGVSRDRFDPEDDCQRFNRKVLEFLPAHGVRKVILAGRWALYATGERYRFESGGPVHLFDGVPASGGNVEVFERGLRRTIDQLHDVGMEVVLVGPVPEVGWNVPGVLARAHRLGRSAPVAPSVAAFSTRQQGVLPLLELLEQQGTVTAVWPHRWFCDARTCEIVRQGIPLYFDDDHPTASAAADLAPLFSEALWPH